MSQLYYALQGANGYFKFVSKRGLKFLAYTTPYNLTKLNFEGLHPQDVDELQIELRVIRDFELFNSSKMKEGFTLVKVPLGDIDSFERYNEK